MTSTAPFLRIVPPDPTAQQRVASDPAASVWVNASAGSGKTTILTHRVTRLLLSGVRPERILCLTFTRAAAAEMSLRVTERLSHWAVCSDNELSASLTDLQGRVPTSEESTRARRLFAEALACPGGMRIRTLHAFGQEILRRFPIESGLAPHFSVIEEEDAQALQEDCLKNLLQEAALPDSQLGPAIVTLIDRLGEKAFRDMARHVLREKTRIRKALIQYGDLDALTAHIRNALHLAPDDTITSLIDSAFDPETFHADEIRKAATTLLEGKPTYIKRGQKILAWLDLPPSQQVASYYSYARFFLKADGNLYTDYGDTKLLKQHPDLDRLLRREATRLQSLNERIAAVETATLTAAALAFGQALITSYSHRKHVQAALDYDDLVHETLNLLQRPGIAPWILHKLDDGLDHLLVDEAQDTSRAQWDIVATLADEFFAGSTAHDNNRTLFVVGDEKQSIYSFQNADPAAFAAMRHFFKNKIEGAEKFWSEIPLHVSFRSAPAVLRAVDAVFAVDQTRQGVAAHPIEHVSFKRDHLFGRVEVWPLIPQPEKNKNKDTVWDLPLGYENERDPQAELAAHIASTIKGWLVKNERLPDSDRPIRAGDIMILLRRRGRFADLMVSALKQNNVPVTGVDRMRLMEQLPVMDLLALIQFTLLPEDDLNLAALLRGPLLNMSEDELMHLAARRNGIPLWHRLKASTAHKPAHDYLAAWLGKADFMTPFAMLTHVLNAPCPASTVSGKKAIWSRLGLDALDPIEELLNAAQNFGRHHAPSLQSFLHHLAASDSEIKRELDHGQNSGEGQIRIMTVHASKGLEAPIVFLPDTTNVPRVQDVPKFLWSDNGLPFYLPSRPDTGLTRPIWNHARTAQLEEYRRLLYVALTRASHRLYIGGWELARNETDGTMSWYNLIKNGMGTSEAHAQNTNPEIIVWEDAVLPAKSGSTAPTTTSTIPPLPDWARTAAPAEKRETATLSPSQLGAQPSSASPDQAFARGRIIHRLLQSLPDVDEDKREAAATRFLAHPQHRLIEVQQNEVRSEVMKLLHHPDFAHLFGPQSRAEVPLAGIVAGQKFSGQVDRLVLTQGEVWVVDYKTNRPPPADAADIPDAYRAQMEAYRALLQSIYPGQKVRCFLLWTYTPHLMEVLARQG